MLLLDAIPLLESDTVSFPDFHYYLLYWCVTEAEWSEVLLRVLHDSPGFEPSHGVHWQATIFVDGGFWHGPQHLTRNVWANSTRCMGISVVDE